jgi:hypothetical protein
MAREKAIRVALERTAATPMDSTEIALLATELTGKRRVSRWDVYEYCNQLEKEGWTFTIDCGKIKALTKGG